MTEMTLLGMKKERSLTMKMTSLKKKRKNLTGTTKM